jgi:hypothetical protein
MAWFFRVIELADGRWACRHGREEYDAHAELRLAIEHMRARAYPARPAELFLQSRLFRPLRAGHDAHRGSD